MCPGFESLGIYHFKKEDVYEGNQGPSAIDKMNYMRYNNEEMVNFRGIPYVHRHAVLQED